jgi:hypothetical protein
MNRALLATALLLTAPLARAESPRWGAVELRISGYLPNVDAEFRGQSSCGTSPSCTPFGDAFGTSRNLMFQAMVSKSIFTKFGTLDVGIGAGFWDKAGFALAQGSSAHSRDEISFKIIPLSLTLTYRFDWLVETYGIPVAPYLRTSLLRYQWWLTNPSGTSSFGGHSGSGATSGYSFTGGIAFLLDFLDPTLARDADNDTGINHTYVFVDVTKTYVKSFGSSKSWDLSDAQPVWSAGIIFVF